ncbi:MAG: hypothetical protein ABIO72_04380 [Patescibacteria group bacterium]
MSGMGLEVIMFVEKLMGMLSEDAKLQSIEILDGKLFYLTRHDADGFVRAVYGDWQSEPYYEITQPCVRNGKLAFVAELEDTFVVYDGQRGKSYSFIDGLQFTPDDTLAYLASDESPSEFLVLGDREGKRYRDVSMYEFGLSFEEGKPLYLGMTLRDGQKRWCVVYGEFESEDFDGVNEVVIEEEKPCFVGSEGMADDDAKDFLVWGDWKSVGYRSIKKPCIIEGKPSFVASDGVLQEQLVWGDWESERYEVIFFYPYDIEVCQDRKLAFLGSRGAKTVVQWGDWKRSAERFYSFHDGKPLYSSHRSYQDGKHERGKMVLMRGDEVLSAEYDRIHGASFQEGKALFIACENKCEFVVWGDWKSPECNGVFHLNVVDARLQYCAIEGDLWYAVSGDVKSPEYQNSLPPKIRFYRDQPLFLMKRDGKYFVVWGEETSRPYDYCTQPTERDGLFFFVARDERRVYEVTVQTN